MSTIHCCFTPGQPVNSETIQKMLAASAYWQPDNSSSNISANQQCRLGKANLFTTDLSKMDHVYHDLETGNLITANARLDNRQPLAEQLELAKGLSKLTDSQLILKAYQHWGEECPKYLLGDFVFVIWDELKQQLFSARDHFGIKALYYSFTDQGIMLTNEHNAFFLTDWKEKKYKEEWIVMHLWGQGVSKLKSPCVGIDILPPAHSITFSSAGMRLTRYWSLQDKDDWQGRDDESLIEELSQRFQLAVKNRLDTAYPLAAELSEGLDSNGIVGHAAKMLGEKPIYTYSYQCQKLSKENRHIWEETYLDIFEMLEMHPNLQPVWSDLPPINVFEELEALYKDLGAVMNCKGGFMVIHRLANQQGSRVILSGWGGDHCVSSYGDYYESELFSQRKFIALQQLLKGKWRRGRGSHSAKAWMGLLLKHGAPSIYQWWQRTRGGLEQALWRRSRLSVLKSVYIKQYQCKHKLKRFTDQYHRYTVKGYHQRELFEVGVEGRLMNAELVARRFRLEYRYPMLDVPLVEMAYNMPSHLKNYHGVERYMFRRILEGLTTKKIQWRRKADVSHPNHDRSATEMLNNINLEILLKKDWVIKYCDTQKLNAIFSSKRDKSEM